MPSYRFLVPGLGSVTTEDDTEACARLRLGDQLGMNPDSIPLLGKDPGAPVFEGDPDRPDCLRNLAVQEAEDMDCDCSFCEPDLIRVGRLEAVIGALALGVAMLFVLHRR